MGNPKQKWTPGEEEALKAGIAKHGAGKWKLIQKDPEFNKFLHSRSNIDLKDKWRNMSAAVQGSRDKSRVPKPKPSPDAPATPSTLAQNHIVLPVPIAVETPADHVKDDSGKDLPDANNALRYEMIFEVLKEQNGMDVGSIFAHIEKRSDEPLPHNFRKHLGAKLRRLVQQEKLEKVENLYRLKVITKETSVSIEKENLVRPQLQNLAAVYSKIGESLEEAAKTAAYKVVDAENKSAMAAEAVKDFEKISKMAEETDSILQLAKVVLDRCSCGEIFIAA